MSLRRTTRAYGPLLSRSLERLYRGPDFPMRLRMLRWFESVVGRRRIVVEGLHGEQYAVDHRDLVQAAILRDRAFEPEVVDALRSHLRPRDLMLDIGANIGAIAIPVAVCTGASVIAFEADPEVAEVLRANARLSGLSAPSFIVECVALADEVGVSALRRAPESNIGRSTLEVLADAVGDVLVSVTTIDVLRDTGVFQQASAWKIDVEGAEARVLAGASKTLAEAPPRVIVFEDQAGSVAESAVARRLDSFGYEVSHIRRPMGEVQERENFLAVRRELQT